MTRQTGIEASLRQAVVNRTIIFQRLVVIKSNVNLTTPLQAHLNVRARKVVTPKQIQLLKAFIAKEMSKQFELVFELAQIEEVRSENP